jgi:hypothetical protein
MAYRTEFQNARKVWTGGSRLIAFVLEASSIACLLADF